MRAAWLVIFLVGTPCFVVQGKAQSMPANPPNQPVDSIQLVSVKTESGQPIRRGQSVPMVVSLRYTLSSLDSAVISVSTAQFRDPQHCVGNGELVDAREIVVYRGSGVVSIPITWSGDTGEHSKGRVFGRGSLSFTSMFWDYSFNGQGLGAQRWRLGIFAFYNDYCVAF